MVAASQLSVFIGAALPVPSGGFSSLETHLQIVSGDGNVAYDGALRGAGLRFALPPGRYVVTARDREVFDDQSNGPFRIECSREVVLSPGSAMDLVTTRGETTRGETIYGERGCVLSEGRGSWSVEVTIDDASGELWWFRLADPSMPRAYVWYSMPGAVRSIYFSRRRRPGARARSLEITGGSAGRSTATEVTTCGMEFRPCSDFVASRAPECTLVLPSSSFDADAGRVARVVVTRPIGGPGSDAPDADASRGCRITVQE